MFEFLLSTAAAFGTGMALDVMPACPGLALLADAAAGPDDSFEGASDAELTGVLAAWERLEAHMTARKLAAAAELIRRRPEPGCEPQGPARMPAAYEEFTGDELANLLAESRARAHGTLARTRNRGERAKRGKPGPPDGRDPPRGTSRAPGPGFTFTPAGQHGPPGGYGTWRLTIPGDGPDLIITLDPITTQDCDHRFEATGHDPGVKLRHLSQIRHATCTGPVCRRPASQSDFEHNIPYEAGGRTCLCNTGPKCRHDHRLKQHPRWKAAQLPDGTFRWTTPSGRTYTTEPTRHPI